MSLMDTLGNADPTGVLSAAGAAIGLVGTVLRAVPVLKNASNAARNSTNFGATPSTLHRAQTTSPATDPGIDTERERRAYETVNFVLRELGNQICAAGLVDEHALTRALDSAARHVDFNLFSGEGNRLFGSLAPKLGDPVLVNSVFTSIYFIGALIAELTRSLPNYKESYVPLGPRIVQQLFRAAIGEGAFGENLTANLDAYKTLANTAGLLRPTDIGYSAFPGFPTFSTCRYSSRSSSDTRQSKSIYDRLIKHLEKSGFPQPTPTWQSEVGMIRDWRFIAGNAPSRTVDVERADKNIGESFGRVLHWLICSAHMMPLGQAVIVYYSQHVELVRWIGSRLGFCLLSAATDVTWTGVHAQLDSKLRAIIDSWVIIMPSARVNAARRASFAQWEQSHMHVCHQLPVPNQADINHNPTNSAHVPESRRMSGPTPVASPVSQSKTSSPPPQIRVASMPIRKKLNEKSINQRLDDVERDFNEVLLPRCTKLLTAPPADAKARAREYTSLTQHIERAVIGWLDGFPVPGDHPARPRKKAMIVHAQKTLETLDAASRAIPVVNHDDKYNAELTGSPFIDQPMPPVSAPTPLKPNISIPQFSPPVSPTVLPPPYSPSLSSSSTGTTVQTAPPLQENPKPKYNIPRRAPPPPRKARALYSFEPGNNEELGFNEGDMLEVMEKNAELEEQGWCKAKIKGTGQIGLAPLEYIEIEQRPAVAAQAIPSVVQTLPFGPSFDADTGSVNPLAPLTEYTSISTSSSFSPNTSYPEGSLNVSQHFTNNVGQDDSQGQLENQSDVTNSGFAVSTALAVGCAINQPEPIYSTVSAIEASQPSQAVPNDSQLHMVEPFTENEQNTSTDKFVVTTPPQNLDFDDPDSPGPMIDLSAFSMPPFEPQAVSLEPNSIVPFTTGEPNIAVQESDFTNTSDLSNTETSTEEQQGSVAESCTTMTTNILAPMSTVGKQEESDSEMYVSSTTFAPASTTEDQTVPISTLPSALDPVMFKTAPQEQPALDQVPYTSSGPFQSMATRTTQDQVIPNPTTYITDTIYTPPPIMQEQTSPDPPTFIPKPLFASPMPTTQPQPMSNLDVYPSPSPFASMATTTTDTSSAVGTAPNTYDAFDSTYAETQLPVAEEQGDTTAVVSETCVDDAAAGGDYVEVDTAVVAADDYEDVYHE